jgi:hypothetical protein
VALITDTIAFPRCQFFRIDNVLTVADQALAMSLGMLTTWTVTTFATDGQFMKRGDTIETVVVIANKITFAGMARKA